MCPNTIPFEGFGKLLQWVLPQIDNTLPVRFTMEATGEYYESLAYYLSRHGYTIHVVLPNQFRKYADSLGNKTKTDAIDSRILSRIWALSDHWTNGIPSVVLYCNSNN